MYMFWFRCFLLTRSDLGSIRIDSDWKFVWDESKLGLKTCFRFIIRIERELIGLIINSFTSNEIQKVFGLVQKQILEWLEIVLIRSDWIPIRNFRQGTYIFWICTAILWKFVFDFQFVFLYYWTLGFLLVLNIGF